MINIEYINVHYQEGSTSYALKSQRRIGDEPILTISVENRVIAWELSGLKVGKEEQVSKIDPRKNRIDFYIGFEDLKRQRTTFPNSSGNSNGLELLPTNSQGTERQFGKTVKMMQPIGRTVIDDVFVPFPQFTLTKNNSIPVYFNVDAEYAFYKIENGADKLTSREIHFGIQHSYIVSVNENNEQLIAILTMNENQYSAILECIDRAIEWYENLQSS